MLLNPFRFGAAPAGGIDLPGLWSAFGIKRLITGYSGPALKARRSSDNATRDIGFNGGGTDLDTTDLLSWAGAGSAFVDTWYDQKNSNHIQQTSLGLQPRIVNAGVYDGFVRFDGTDDYLISLNNSGTPQAITLAFRVVSRSNPTYGVIVEKSADPNTTNGFSVATLNVSSASRLRMTVSADTGGAGQFVAWNTSTADVTTEGAWVVRFDRSKSTASSYTAWLDAWKDGSLAAKSLVIVSNNPGSQTAFTANKYYVGARDTAVLPGPLNMKNLVIYEANRDTDIAAITAEL